MPHVQLFIPCFVDQLYPNTGMHMAGILERAGCDVSYNPNQTCCGQPAFNAGYWKESAKVAEKFLNDFREDSYIVTPSGSCAGFARNHFERILDETHAPQIAQLKKNLFELTEFLVDVLGVTDLNASFPHKATYHDACGALRECRIKTQPRQLLDKVAGLELIEMKEAETCCGFGGTFAVKMEPISIGMAQTKVQSALDSGAEYIISTDVSCLMHIQGYIDKHSVPLKTAHIADVLMGES